MAKAVERIINPVLIASIIASLMLMRVWYRRLPAPGAGAEHVVKESTDSG